jgi:hypothetical protein
MLAKSLSLGRVMATSFVIVGVLAAHQVLAQVEGRSRGPASDQGSFSPGPGGVGPRYWQDDDYRPNRRQLGVQVRNLETGVQLTSVARGGVADRNGLSQGDIIVTVAGYQVGYVDGLLYDLGDELARNVDRRGRVTLLVLRNRDGRLLNNTIDFTDPSSGGGGGSSDQISVRGIIENRTNARLSPAAIQIARILDVAGGEGRYYVVARQVDQKPGQFPLDFNIGFTSRPGRKYAAQAFIYDGPRMYVTDLEPFPARPNNLNRVTLRANREQAVFDPTSWYRSHLGRNPSSREAAAWREQLEDGQSQEEIEAQILGGSEAYDRRGANPDAYVRDVAKSATGKEPTQDQIRRFTEQLKQPGANRSSVVEQMLKALRQP